MITLPSVGTAYDATVVVSSEPTPPGKANAKCYTARGEAYDCTVIVTAPTSSPQED